MPCISLRAPASHAARIHLVRARHSHGVKPHPSQSLLPCTRALPMLYSAIYPVQATV